MQKFFNYISIFIICALLCLLGVNSCSKKQLQNKVSVLTKTDTLFINKPYKVETIKQVEKPVNVTVYKTDTILRNEVIKNDLILKVEYKRNFLYKDLSFLKVDKIATNGTITSNYYNVADAKKIEIFNDGKTQIQKRKFIIPKIMVGITAGTILAYTGIKAYNEIK